jgi:hypothetical protein
LPQHNATMRVASLHLTPPVVIHLPVLMEENFDVPHAPWPVDWSAVGRTAVAAFSLLVGGEIHTHLPPPLV